MSRAESMDKRDEVYGDLDRRKGTDLNSATDFALLCMLNPELAQKKLEAINRFNKTMEKWKKEFQTKESKEPELE